MAGLCFLLLGENLNYYDDCYDIIVVHSIALVNPLQSDFM